MRIPPEKTWLWAHPAGSHNGKYSLPARSTIPPHEAADRMGIDNLIMVVYDNRPEPPFDEEMKQLADLDRVVWSIVGDSSSVRNDRATDLEEVCRLAGQYPNLCGAIMDDFFLGEASPDGRQARYGLEDVRRFRETLHAQPRPLDLWVVMYDRLLGRPLEPHLAECDVVTFWTWEAKNLVDLEGNFARLESMAPDQRRMLGCYMWDYGHAGGGREIPPELMKKQCRLAAEWIENGRIDGVIFLASCICDLDVAGVRYVRELLTTT